MKKIRSLLLVAALAGMPSAMLADYDLVVELISGDTHEYAMKEQPVVTFVDGGVRIDAIEGTAFYPRSEFGRFYFNEVNGPENSVEEIAADVNFRFLDRDNVAVSFTPDEDTRIMLFDMSGRIISETKAVDGEAIVSLSGLTPGIYILYTHNRSIKITKK